MAAAANYIHRMGWKQDTHCYIEVQLNKEIKDKLVNYSARAISNKLTIKKWKKLGVELPAEIEVNTKTKAALISPDGKISPKSISAAKTAFSFSSTPCTRVQTSSANRR